MTSIPWKPGLSARPAAKPKPATAIAWQTAHYEDRVLQLEHQPEPSRRMRRRGSQRQPGAFHLPTRSGTSPCSSEGGTLYSLRPPEGTVTSATEGDRRAVADK